MRRTLAGLFTAGILATSGTAYACDDTAEPGNQLLGLLVQCVQRLSAGTVDQDAFCQGLSKGFTTPAPAPDLGYGAIPVPPGDEHDI